MKIKDLLKDQKENYYQKVIFIVCTLEDITYRTDEGPIPKEIRKKINSWWKNNKNSEIELYNGNILDLMVKVNKSIKNNGIKSRYRNRFYAYKKKYLSLLLKSGKVTVLDCGEKLWGFKIGEYFFHQPKFLYKDIVPSEIGEEYVPEPKENLPEFSLEEYKQCLITIAYLLWSQD